MDDRRQATSDPTRHPMVITIRDAIVGVTDRSLLGLSVYGSLATGDFEPDVSDIDLIVVLRDPPDEALVRRLGTMHECLARAESEWNDRIEVDYVSVRGLARCRTHATTIARISPGERLHLVEAGRDFLLDWYPARQVGLSVLGAPLASLIPPIPEAEYLEEVRSYLASFARRFDEHSSPGSQAYAILTMCRGLATLRSGDRPSKREAADETRREFPRWSNLIDRALRWRDRQWDDDQPDGSETVAETRAFIAEMDGLLELSSRLEPGA
jgi:predicted nucleotidyltransferase